MKTWLKQYDMNVFLAEDYRDIRFAREAGVEKCILIPNGAAEDEFLPGSNGSVIREKLGISASDFLILHVGDFTGIKGHLEAIKIFSRANIQNAVLVMVGSNFDQFRLGNLAMIKDILRGNIGKFKQSLRFTLMEMARAMAWPANRTDHKRIIFASLSRQETVAVFQAADLFLFPSEIECSPIVLFECAASRTPFLASDVGNAAEIARWTGGGEILPTTHEKGGLGLSHVEVSGSARMLERFWRDRTKGKAMGEVAFTVWQQQFTWENIADQYESLYTDLLKEKG